MPAGWWSVGLVLRTGPPAPAVFLHTASMAQVPSSSTTVSKCAQCALHKVLPHAQRAAEALLCQGQWEFVHWVVHAGFPPTGTRLLPDACACECLCIYIHFTVQSAYRKASSLFKYFSSTSYCMKSGPHCHSFSQLNGVKEPFLLLTAAITIRVGGRGNEHAAHAVPSSHQLLLRARCSRQSGSKAWGGKQV